MLPEPPKLLFFLLVKNYCNNKIIVSIYYNMCYVLDNISSVGKESACNAGDPGLTPGLEDPLEKGKATHSSILA